MTKFKNLSAGLFFLIAASISTIQAQVTADFEADDLVVCPGVPVVFTNLSSYPAGSSPTYLWSFPSGFASSLTDENPTVYYYTPGVYSVTLTTTVAGVGSDEEIKTAYITVVSPPDANFTYTIPDVCNQMEVHFTDASTAGSAPISSYLWDFEDATFSAEANPVHTFTSENTFYVILFITDANGCSDNTTVPVSTLAPVESAISSSGSVFSCGTALSPTISAATSEGTEPYSYSWDYGNGTSSDLPSSTVTYTDCGTYDITYTVTDANGCSLTTTYEDYVEISCPEVDFSMSDDTVCEGTSASFTNLSDTGAISYYWQFNYPTASSTSTEENPTAEFVADGMRIIRLTVTYPGGCTAYHQDTMQVVDIPTITGIMASDTFGCEIPFVTTLTPVGLTGTGPFTFYWESDGMTSTDSAATFTYNDYLNYTVSLTVTDANGCSKYYTFPGFIKIKKPTNTFTATPVEGCAPLKVTFTNTSSSLYVPLSYFVWDYADGTIDTTYTLGSHSHWFTAAGTYNVTMTLYTIDGCPKTSNLVITVGNEVADFDILNIDDPTCNPVEINNLSAGADETTIDWGDGTSTFLVPGTLDTLHVYPAGDTATYIITLTADDRGCISTWTDTITVLPVITIVSSSWNCSNPLEFYFTVDTTVVTGDFCWDFGSGDEFCNQVEVSYTFPGPGTYGGEITTTDPIEYEGCTLDQTFSALVPDNDFTFSATTIGACGSFEYAIASNVAPDFPSELTYTWNIGPSSITGYSDVVTDTSAFNYIFPGEDAYPIEMVIEDVNGCVYTSVDTVIISGAVALFTVDSIVGCSPFTVYLSDASSVVDAGGDIYIASYEWNFSGGTCPTFYGLNPPPCTFASGTHSVTLTVTDNGGCSFSYTEEIEVVSDVIADFVADELACNATEPLYFSNTSTGEITDVLWDFGDGATSTDYSALHAYPSEGTYTVSLTVSDSLGCTDTKITDINVVHDSIYANFDVTYLTASSCPPIPLKLTNTSTGDYLDFWWEVERETGMYTYTIDTILLTYTLPGTYDVSIFVTGATGCIDTLTVENALNIPGPTGTMEYAPMIACTPAEISFDISDLTADLTYVDFGDGDTTLVTDDISYSYTEEGVYCPTLILIDASGCSFQITCDSSITIYETHAIDIAVSDTGLCLGDALTIYNTSTGSALNPIEGYSIDYGDGTPAIPLADFDSLTYTYASSGTYLLKIFTLSDVACNDTIQYEIHVSSIPEGDAVISPVSGCFPLDVNFTVTGLIADVAILDFGDGTTDTIAGDISYTYTTYGIFNPVLTLINGDACAVEIEFEDSVYVAVPPVAGLIIPDTVACSGEELVFINNSSDTTISPITHYTLDFGDGTTPFSSDSMDSVYHAFATDGSYISTFIVENSAGCTDTLLFNTYADQLPEGDLNISPLTGCAPIDVNFEVLDLLADEAIIDFGDGNSDTVTASITYTYSDAGNYTPVFYLNNSNGCSAVLTLDTIEVEQIPSAGFTIADTAICIADPVTIINTSLDTVISPITAYAVKYGDGSVDILSEFDTLEYTYASAGVYTITVIAQNAAGCKDTILHSVEVIDNPVATVDILPAGGCIPFDVNFNLESAIADEIILFYGDGSFDTISGDIIHSYSTAGIFEPYLLLNNNASCYDSVVLDIVEAGVTPVADFTFTDSTICLGEDVEIFNNSWDTIISPVTSYTIDFGDGYVTSPASFTSLTHNYTAAGDYSISLSVANDLGCEDIITKNVSVGEVPFATLGLDPLEGCLPLDITFDFESVDADEIIVDFGDGFIDTVAGDISHTYLAAGSFSPIVSLLNANGCSFDVLVTDVINVGVTPVADFTFTDSTICLGEDVEIFNNSWDTIISPVTSYTIDFGDGYVTSPASFTSLTHTYTAAGDYTISLSVANDLGCDDIITKTIAVNAMPEGEIDFLPASGCYPLDVTFEVSGLTADSAYLNFGDGTGEVISGDVIHTFTVPGLFVPELSLINNNGCNLTLEGTDTIHVAEPPVANMTVSDTSVCAGDVIVVYNTSTGTMDAPITDVFLDYGDGSDIYTSDGFDSIPHAFTSEGDFIMELTVSNSLGCESTYNIPVSIAAIPTAVFDVEPVVGCGTLISTFNIISSSADSLFINTGVDTVYVSGSSMDYLYNTPGVYTPEIMLLNSTGCSAEIPASDSITVSFAPHALMALSDTMPLCSGEEIFIINLSVDTIADPLINPIDNYTVRVNGSIIYTETFMDSLAFNLATAGDYLITLITSNSIGCMDSTSSLITVYQAPDAVAGVNETICPGMPLLLDGSASTGGTAYEWTPAGLFVNNTVSQPLGSFPTSTMVYLEYSNAYCSDIDSVMINVLSDLELQAWPDTAICIGESVQIYSQYEAEDIPVSLVWLNGDYLSSTTVSDPVATPLNTITYTVSATCGTLVDYEDVVIVVNSLPTVVANDTLNAYYGEAFNLTAAASGNGPFDYSWTPTDYLSCSNCQNTTATPPADATYYITVVDENNCIAMDSVVLRLGYDCGQYLGLPNLFTPNNDGFNDVFTYQSDAIRVLTYFRIYDRWGRLMYESTDLYGSWDGTFNGVPCDPGVYVYSIQGSCFDGEVFINSGNVTLIR